MISHFSSWNSRESREDIPFANPDLLLDLSLNPAHPGYDVEAMDPEMISSHHKFFATEDLTVSCLGKLTRVTSSPGECLSGFLCQEVPERFGSSFMNFMSLLLRVKEIFFSRALQKKARKKPFFVEIITPLCAISSHGETVR